MQMKTMKKSLSKSPLVPDVSPWRSDNPAGEASAVIQILLYEKEK